MDVSVPEFNSLDLERELFARGLQTAGTKPERFERLTAARQDEVIDLPWRLRKPAINKFGARLQLDDFADIETLTKAESTLLSCKVQWRLEHVRQTEDDEGLEYFHPDVLGRIDRSKTYILNVDEFLVRQEPYVHKIFAIFASRTSGQDHSLCYARSLAKLRRWDENLEEFNWPIITSENMFNGDADFGVLKSTLMTPQNMAKALGYVLKELKEKSLDNYIAIACDAHRLGLGHATELLAGSDLTLLPYISDIGDLQKSLRNMFSAACVRCAMRLTNELYELTTYEEQLNELRNSNPTKNLNALVRLMDYVNQVPEILLAMWKSKEHEGKPISLASLNNKFIKIFGAHLKRELPPITYDDCVAGSGLLQMLVFDTLWYLSPEKESEELQPEFFNIIIEN